MQNGSTDPGGFGVKPLKVSLLIEQVTGKNRHKLLVRKTLARSFASAVASIGQNKCHHLKDLDMILVCDDRGVVSVKKYKDGDYHCVLEIGSPQRYDLVETLLRLALPA